jgi:site-specific DNA-methyltransferase (adenine-specific)
MTHGAVIRGDCLRVMEKIKPESIDLVFADPPFNIGYIYDGYKDNLEPKEYLSWCASWMEGCYRIMKPTASMFVAIGDEYAAEIKKILDQKMQMRNWIIWTYNFGVHSKYKFGRDHTHILYYIKDKNNTRNTRQPKYKFNREEILIPSARQTTYNDKRANAGGRVPGDVWHFPRVCGTFKERNQFGHKCQMPEDLLARIISVSTDKGDVVFDPFAGTGTTAAVANKLGRKFITCDISKKYIAGVLRRIE